MIQIVKQVLKWLERLFGLTSHTETLATLETLAKKIEPAANQEDFVLPESQNIILQEIAAARGGHLRPGRALNTKQTFQFYAGLGFRF